jgi:predicted lysophospholipase L1 biosynthesis ABC-type transport system permease subunit
MSLLSHPSIRCGSPPPVSGRVAGGAWQATNVYGEGDTAVVTPELGLLRAVGMTRKQLRASIRHEAAIVASFGTALGLTIGIAFAYALVKAGTEWGSITSRSR